jgi:hypothetical protein
MLTLELPFPTSASDPTFRAVREIESLYNDFLIQLPIPERLKIFDLDPTAATAAPESLLFGLVMNISQRMWFLHSSSVLKARSLIEGLSVALSSENYLVWTLVARSLVEHSAVLSKYVATLENLGCGEPRRTIAQTEAINDCLFRYSNGTRFHWDALLAGDVAELQKDFDPPEKDRSLNVLTAIDHSAKSRQVLAPNRIWYDMLSDFVHPNKASHSFYLGLTGATDRHDDLLMTEVDVAAATPPARAEFILRWTLPAVLVNAGNIESSLRRLAPLVRLWEERTEATIEILPGTTTRVRFHPAQDS